MKTLLRGTRALATDRQAVTALEYGLIGGIIGVAVVAALTAVWAPMNPAFTLICSFLVNTASAGF